MCIGKEDLRKAALEKRRELSSKSYKDNSICSKFFDTFLKSNIDKFFVYVSMNTEVDTHKIITDLINLRKKVYIPRTFDSIMSVITLEKLPDSFETDKLGNLLDSGSFTETKEVCDCAVVPLLAFNKRLYRLGYGGGYYDRFLRTFNGLKVGLAYDEQLFVDFKEENHDVPLDFVVTPTRIVSKNEVSLL